jgi:hypothetical protein
MVGAVLQLLGSLSLLVPSGFFAAGGTVRLLGTLLLSILMIVKAGSGHKEVETSPAIT